MEKLNAYAKKFNINYRESLDGLNISLLNNPVFKSMGGKKFDIDMNDIEEEIQKHTINLEHMCNENGSKNKSKINILNIHYSDHQKLLYSLLAFLIENKIYSFKGYIISSFVIKINTSYYSAWIYRRKCLKKLNLNYLNDLEFTRFIISENIKSFQSWYHRRWLIEYIYKSNLKKKGKNNDQKEQNNVTQIGIPEDDEMKRNVQKMEKNIYSNVHKNMCNDDDLFDHEQNFISSDEEICSIHSSNESYHENVFISNFENSDLDIEKEDILHENFKDIIENSTFFKNSLHKNEEIKINIYEFLYNELLYTNCHIFLDTKNYNSWAHKTWLINKFSMLTKNKYIYDKYNILLHEYNYINYFLKCDIYNNSVWVYRHFIFTKLKHIKNINKLEKEIIFCLNYGQQFYDNEALFSYFINILLKYIKLCQKIRKLSPIVSKTNEAIASLEETSTYDIFEIPIVNFVKNNLTKLATKSKFVLLFLAQLYAYNGSHYEEAQCYKYLEKNDNFNDFIWSSKIEGI
ncbi:protein farnesyltransferase subunit alpha, putative [Plasmodium yoelii]|uniref:Protein farnesyltransferase/geranylgeranyltransferase type-1 subunit alpha n=2 Tax=Plasmodium yoelii TaxID=5861 RepID=A0AAE9WYB1_PLAYO|nr:protein farnesyltransferase subunit alpha, putative [Plasmodium yoelii]WBY61221.1 protein farnesyltransferase subunit alpha [Plasmodium yoelii yoelii]CDU20929.1 protein geranylgeranyltransferase type II, alpha subunit, putative [Plasmodium yoelii]VTZ81895.1 protein farnesyltransferase subunit alpha, putative [Plasmodium yoelii]|eukprot:XP_022813037.1 protein farnesyltransferase subunit alpha, putative [Plasmodium yoelii]